MLAKSCTSMSRSLTKCLASAATLAAFRASTYWLTAGHVIFVGRSACSRKDAAAACARSLLSRAFASTCGWPLL